MVRLLRWGLGNVRFKITGSRARRFLYECAGQGLRLWNTEASDGEYHGCIRAANYRRCAKVARQYGVRLHIETKQGFPFLRRRYRRRVGLVMGLCGFFVLLAVLSGYVWRIDITGNERLSDQQILQALAHQGVQVGMPKSALDVYTVCNGMFLELDELSWIFINRRGTTLYVELRERVDKPEMFSPYDPSNIVAAHTAQILRVDTYYGQAVVKPGDVVTQGQLLISGVWTDREGDWKMVHAEAHVWAAARIVKQVRVEFEQQQTVPDETPTVRYSVQLFGFSVPLYFRSAQGEYVEQCVKPLILFGTELPVALCITEYRDVQITTVTLSQQQAEDQAMAQLAVIETQEFSGGVIREKNIAVSADQNGLTVTAVYEVETDIAQQQPISWQEPLS